MELAVEQVLTQVVAFLIMYWVLKRFAWKPLLKLMDERKQMIASDFEAIKNEKYEIQRIQEDYKQKLKALEAESKLKIHEAVEKGHELAQEIAKEARTKAQDILNKAEFEMNKEINEAKKHFKDQVVDISVSLANKLIQEELNKDRHKKLIDDTLQQVDK
jgi:F-type H+-transporting ATPase subunit b